MDIFITGLAEIVEGTLLPNRQKVALLAARTFSVRNEIRCVWENAAVRASGASQEEQAPLTTEPLINVATCLLLVVVVAVVGVALVALCHHASHSKQASP